MSFRLTRSLMLLVLVSVFSHSNTCRAQHFYDFINEFTGDTWAQLELSTVPATVNDVVSLTFSSELQTFLGLGPIYAGDFDVAVNGGNSVIEDSSGRLIGSPANAFWRDNDPPYPGANYLELQIYDSNASFPTNALIVYENDQGTFAPDGYWQSVPEPIHGTSFVLLLLLGCLGVVRK